MRDHRDFLRLTTLLTGSVMDNPVACPARDELAPSRPADPTLLPARLRWKNQINSTAEADHDET